jgi:hypothetical protein
MMNELVTLYRPVGPAELALVAATGYRRWPPRLPEQPVFFPVTNVEYAREIALRWNVTASGAGYVTMFRVNSAFMDRYAKHQVGGRNHVEWWIPAEDLDELNENIVGLIDVTEEYGK